MHSQDNQTIHSKQHFEVVVQTEGIAGLDHLYNYLQNHTPLSKQQLKTYALKGAVWLTENRATQATTRKTERLRRLKKILKSGDKIDFYYHAALLNSEPTAPTLIADFDSYSVWLKPRGMLSQGSKWGDHTALYRWIEMHYKPNQQSRQCWIVHRLDRATCGLMLVAHSKKMASTLSQYFEQGQIHKTYQANVWGTFPATQQSIDLPVQGKKALSHVTLLNTYADYEDITLNPPVSRVKVTIETGRKHQIRYHLSEMDYPLLGDRLYSDESLDAQLKAQLPTRPNLQLTASRLAFLCPIHGIERSFQLSDSQLDLLSF